MTPIEPITDEQIKVAIDRLARTEDGRTLYLFLQRRLMGVSASTDPGALQSDHGERRFASALIALMSKGIAESGGRTSSSGSSTGGNGDQPIVFAVPGPRRVDERARGAGRRVNEHTVVPGWNDERAG